MISDIKYIFISMRPKQWIKNVFVFAGLIFSHNLFDIQLLTKTIAGFSLFSLAASSIYILNDIKDIKHDKSHPEKHQRPLAAGHLKVTKAYVASSILGLCSLAGALLLDLNYFIILVGYIVMNLAYTFKLKQVVILDVMCIAFGFALRVFAGTILPGVRPSDWLIVCTIMLSLFLGFSKRRQELDLLGPENVNHRKVLTDYSVAFLDQMIAIATACAVMSYSLYTIADETVARFQSRNLVLTIPFVIYGIYRYLYLIHQKKIGDNPTTVLFKDPPLFVNGIIWFIVVLLVIY